MLGNFPCFCCQLLTVFKFNLFKIFPQKLSECQTVWSQISTDILSVLIWVQNCLQWLSADEKSQKSQLARKELCIYYTSQERVQQIKDPACSGSMLLPYYISRSNNDPVHVSSYTKSFSCADQESGTGGLDPPEKSQKYRVS